MMSPTEGKPSPCDSLPSGAGYTHRATASPCDKNSDDFGHISALGTCQRSLLGLRGQGAACDGAVMCRDTCDGRLWLEERSVIVGQLTCLVNLRDGPVAVAGNGLHQPRGGHFFTKVVMSVRGQPVVAVDEGHEGEGFREAGKLQFLKTRRWKNCDGLCPRRKCPIC